MKSISLRNVTGGFHKTLLKPGIVMEFHVSRKARDAYNFDQSLFESSGCLLLPDFNAVRHFTALLNSGGQVRARSGEVNAMGLIDEIFHYVIALYKKQCNPRLFEKILAWLNEKIGEKTVDEVLLAFADQFPPRIVYSGRQTPEQYLTGTTLDILNRHLLLEELTLLLIAGINPAYEHYRKELFDDSALTEHPGYQEIQEQLRIFFAYQPPFGPDNQDLLSMLHSPALAEPQSITSQLEYIRSKWGLILEDFLSRLLSGLDLIKEEEKSGGIGPGETFIHDFSGISIHEEYESFSPDRVWMPRLVLLAKSSHVWLDQLTKKYRRPINRLDQIPDEELDELAEMGFTGLWLIGVWERSRASQRIKQMCGNPEAMASAYSIFEYRIAGDLGGEDALENLKQRAWRRGIRMASDMVPNHMGLDSPWLADHPDRFLSLPYSPYPAYTFNGPDLSADPRISIFLEDHYYDRTDAAVVFKWVNRQTGESRYIYHGNDGTAMPWNDTAQLNYLNPETREAVINTIFSVASQFPVIRFDAAMTLSKRHYQRLWFPEPGSGGDIPTRAGNGLPKAEFNRLMPLEFWRQVVDRFSGAHTDNLLLAEAFWLMEAYFVRTLGMHRVYNSAFMNFLKNEDNAQFRTLIKNILTFNPQILKRFVNFMNNPDEETAVAQFGKDDKYIGVCSLMITLPGLPMFGHGQVEGYAEKYGMEYRRAYWDETPDPDLRERHNREIFPLLRKRYIFSDVENFQFYDLHNDQGAINENVICYSNHHGDERSLVIYNNKFAAASGWVNLSAPFAVKEGETETLQQRSLSQGLQLNRSGRFFTVFRDQATHLEYIRNNWELSRQGLYVRLDAFKRAIYLNFREVEDTEGLYARLAAMLNGEGVSDMEDTMRKYFCNPLATPFQELMDVHLLHRLQSSDSDTRKLSTVEFEKRLTVFYEAVFSLMNGITHQDKDVKKNPAQAATLCRRKLERLFLADSQPAKLFPVADANAQVITELMTRTLDTHLLLIPSLIFSLVLLGAGEVIPENDDRRIWEMAEKWRLTDIFSQLLMDMEASFDQSRRSLKRVRVKTIFRELLDKTSFSQNLPLLLKDFFNDNDVRELTGVNHHDGVSWIHMESFNDLMDCFVLATLLESFPDDCPPRESQRILSQRFRAAEDLKKLAQASGYCLEKILSDKIPNQNQYSRH